MNKAQIISATIAPMFTGCTSFLASLTIIITIFRSNVKLSTVYRRLVFSISLMDIAQSLSQGTSSLPMPTDTLVWGAIGNETTCDLQAFFTIIGSCGSVLYSLSLTVYFVLVLNFDISEQNIKKYAEPFLHAVPISYSLVFSIYLYATHNLNPSGVSCWIASPEPAGCDKDPDVDCISKGNVDLLRWLVGGLILVVFVLNCILMVLIWLRVSFQVKKSESYRYSWMVGSDSATATKTNSRSRTKTPAEEETTFKCGDCCLIQRSCWCYSNGICKRSPEVPFSPLAARLSRPSKVAIRRLKETSNRALAYVLAYVATYIFAAIFRIMDTYGGNTPFAIIFLSRFFFPLQGLFNILAFTHSHISTYRRNHNNCSWCKGFWEVIKSGGDSDQIFSTSRRGSLRKQQRVLEEKNVKSGSSRNSFHNLGSTLDGASAGGVLVTNNKKQKTAITRREEAGGRTRTKEMTEMPVLDEKFLAILSNEGGSEDEDHVKKKQNNCFEYMYDEATDEFETDMNNFLSSQGKCAPKESNKPKSVHLLNYDDDLVLHHATAENNDDVEAPGDGEEEKTEITPRSN